MKCTAPATILGAILILALAAGPTGLGQGSGESKESPKKNVIQELQAEIKNLQGLVPDQAAIMTHVGYHWSNLWFAVDKENWPLADFYLSETRSNLKWAVRSKPTRKTAAGVIDLGNIADALDKTQLSQIKEAIGKKNKDRCVKLYDEALQGCYACHKASEKPYLVPHRPEAPEARMINFDPKAAQP